MNLLAAVFLVGTLFQGERVPQPGESNLPLIRVATSTDIPDFGYLITNPRAWPPDAVKMLTEAKAIDAVLRPADAVEAYRRLLSRIDDFPPETLEDHATQAMVAYIRAWIGSLLTTTGHLAEAEAELKQARQIADALLSNWGNVLSVVQLSRKVRTRTGEFQAAAGLREEAAKSFSEALDLVSAVAAEIREMKIFCPSWP